LNHWKDARFSRRLLIGRNATDAECAVNPPAVTGLIAAWQACGLPGKTVSGLITFYWNPIIDKRHLMLISDAAGLGLFAVSGTQKALEFDLHPIMAAALGVLTGIGGGMARDLFLAQFRWPCRRPFMRRRR
jgi:hypothetical protein